MNPYVMFVCTKCDRYCGRRPHTKFCSHKGCRGRLRRVEGDGETEDMWLDRLQQRLFRLWVQCDDLRTSIDDLRRDTQMRRDRLKRPPQ